MSGKHDHQCACVECIAYMETNLQVDLDEWLADDVVFPGISVSETKRRSVLKKRAEQQRQRRALKSAEERAAINELRRTRGTGRSEEQRRIINARRRDKYHESSQEKRTANNEKRRQRRGEVASTLRKPLYFTSP